MITWLQHWVVGGGLIDAIIAITLLEVTILLIYHQQTQRGLKPREYLLNVMSGLCLMLALRCALMGIEWHIMSLFLLAAGLAHVADIILRMRTVKAV